MMLSASSPTTSSYVQLSVFYNLRVCLRKKIGGGGISPRARIDYKALRKINPEAARQAVLECLKTNGGNIADATVWSV
jgi:hypothetical protein